MMKSEHFRIFFTGRKPVTPNGKRNTSVWKNADSFYDFFSLQEVETSSVKIKFSMMYDKQNLYIYSKYPQEYLLFQDQRPKNHRP